MLSGVSNGQKKKTKKTPPPIVFNPVVKEKVPDYPTVKNSKKCFLYITEESKDARTFVKENLFEYGWSGDNARMVVTTYDYDTAAKKQSGNENYIYAKSKQYIEGLYRIDNNNLIFTPDKADKFGKQTYKIIKNKTKNGEELVDENNHRFQKGNCQQAIIGG